jgi:prevent-host-death family protein
MKILNIQEAKTHLSRLVEEVVSGEEIIIAKAGRPCVRLLPFRTEQTPRTAGGWGGQLWIAEDFDATEPRVERLFEGPGAPKARKKAVRRRPRGK